MMTTLTQLNEAKEIPELYVKNKQETALWNTLRRFSDIISLQLDEPILDQASAIEKFSFKDIKIQYNKKDQTLTIRKNGKGPTKDKNELFNNPTAFFKEVQALM